LRPNFAAFSTRCKIHRRDGRNVESVIPSQHRTEPFIRFYGDDLGDWRSDVKKNRSEIEGPRRKIRRSAY